MNESLTYCIEVLKTHLEGLKKKLNPSDKYIKLPYSYYEKLKAKIKHTELGIAKLNAAILVNNKPEHLVCPNCKSAEIAYLNNYDKYYCVKCHLDFD